MQQCSDLLEMSWQAGKRCAASDVFYACTATGSCIAWPGSCVSFFLRHKVVSRARDGTLMGTIRVRTALCEIVCVVVAKDGLSFYNSQTSWSSKVMAGLLVGENER